MHCFYVGFQLAESSGSEIRDTELGLILTAKEGKQAVSYGVLPHVCM